MPDPVASAPPAAPRPVYGLKYYLRRTVLYLLIAYVALCVAVYVFQRKLIYPASRAAELPSALAGYSPKEARDISATAADGVKIRGWQILPASERGKDFDAALKDGGLVDLFFHGNGGHRGHRLELYQTLAGFRCHVVAFDYRGYGDSEGSPSEEGLALDARAAWEWVRSRGVPAERIVLHGESLGCAVAVRLAKELSEAQTPPAGLILESPFASLTATSASLYWFLPVRLLLKERYPSDERIGAVTCPLLIFHGHHDAIVKFEHGKRLFDAAPEKSAGGVAKRFVEFQNAGHNDLRAADLQAYDRELRTFLDARGKAVAGE
jgi:fermentation-respiration switch protein FrsA (DUF1100 family)